MPTPDRLVSGMDDPEAAGRLYAELWNLSAEGASCRIPGPEHCSPRVSSAVADLVRTTDRLLEVKPDFHPDADLLDAVRRGVRTLANELMVQKSNLSEAIRAYWDWKRINSNAVITLILYAGDFQNAEGRALAERIQAETDRAEGYFRENRFSEAAERYRFLLAASQRENWNAIAKKTLADALARRLAAGNSEFIWNHPGWIEEIDSFNPELASRCHQVFDAENGRRRQEAEAESERRRREAETESVQRWRKAELIVYTRGRSHTYEIPQDGHPTPEWFGHH